MLRISPLLVALLLSAGCTEEKPSCQQDQDCPPGRYCQLTTGDCVFDCSLDRDCRLGQECSSRGRCQCAVSSGGVEECDGEDNDCDGQTDEDLGGESCARENEFGICQGERICDQGAWFCQGPVPTAESCNGLDDDCDAETDEQLVEQDCPLQDGVCAGSRKTCQGTAGWSECSYGPDYQPEEVSCDNLDNDCNGQTDDLTGGACQVENAHGLCQGIDRCLGGEWICDASTPAAEICDGFDNNCDGQTDEDLYDPYHCETGSQASDLIDNNCNGLIDEPGGCLIGVQGMGLDLYIDIYENSIYQNPDCSGQKYGAQLNDYPVAWPADETPPTVVLYACSLPGQPSAWISRYRAERACQAQGKRLCTWAELALACGGVDQQQFPYGDTFQPGACHDFTFEPTGAVETGSLPLCQSPSGIFDLSGNLWEWISDGCVGWPEQAGIQGGGYDCFYCEDSCEWCDWDNPDHQQWIREEYACNYPGYGIDWCSFPSSANSANGFRCCYEP